MAFKVDSRANTFQSLQTLTSPALQPQCFLKNHQRWQISCDLDSETGSFLFYLQDPYGITHTTSEFIVEDLPPDVRESLSQFNDAPEAQQKWIFEYLQARLNRSNPYQVHVEKREGHQLFVRFGDYGLKGGGKIFGVEVKDIPLNRLVAAALSFTQVGFGAYLTALARNSSGKWGSAVLLSAGLANGMYAYKERKCGLIEYLKQTGCGVIEGVIAEGIDRLTQGGEGIVKIISQICGPAIRAAASATASEVIETGTLPDSASVREKAFVAGVAARTGSLVSNVLGCAMASEYADRLFMNSLVKRIHPYVDKDILVRFFKKAIENGLSSASSKFTANYYENSMEKDQGKKKNLMQDVFLSAAVSASLGGAISVWNKHEIQISSSHEVDQWLKVIKKTMENFEGKTLQVFFFEIALRMSLLNDYNLHPIVSHTISKFTPKVSEKAFEPEAVSYAAEDCTLEELKEHVVLVHALNHTSPPPHIVEAICALKTEKERILCYLKCVITPQGIVGSHLELGKREFVGELADRPHLHWSWNQLVQPHGEKDADGIPVNNWDNAQIALLEPLSTFENGTYYKPFGVAPYDTFTFEPHRFSKASILLVPESIIDQARAYLTEFQGTIVPFQGSLRPAIIKGLKGHYPETWHVCDENGKLTGHKVHYSDGGYSSKTFLRKADGTVIALMSNSGDNSADHDSQALKEYNEQRRFIGLHLNSVTFWIEDERDAYFKTLRRFKEDNVTVKNNPLFAGNIKGSEALSQLGALKALEFFQKSGVYDPKTGILDVASYILNEAIYADLVSLYYQENPNGVFDLTALDLKMIFESTQSNLRTLLDDIKIHLDAEDPHRAMAAFETYCSLLKSGVSNLHKAKMETKKWVDKEAKTMTNSRSAEKPFCLFVAQEEWETIEVPADNIEFDLGRSWPPKEDAFCHYANKVLRTLPTDLEELKELHHRLSSLKQDHLEDRKELYRLTIICNIIQWTVQEKIYLMQSEDYTKHTSILANKLSTGRGWLAEFGLESNNSARHSGDCLFDCIVDQLGNRMITSAGLRIKAVEYMRQHSGDYSDKPDYWGEQLPYENGEISSPVKDWEMYLDLMRKPGFWGTELEVSALAFLLDCPIVLLAKGMAPRIYNGEGKVTLPNNAAESEDTPHKQRIPLFLHNVDGTYFESCVPFKGLTIDDVYDAVKRKSAKKQAVPASHKKPMMRV